MYEGGNLDGLDVKGGKTGGGWLRPGSSVTVHGLLGSAKAAGHEHDDYDPADLPWGLWAESYGKVEIGGIGSILPFHCPICDFCVETIP